MGLRERERESGGEGLYTLLSVNITKFLGFMEIKAKVCFNNLNFVATNFLQNKYDTSQATTAATPDLDLGNTAIYRGNPQLSGGSVAVAR
ncbi:hypothetical protein J6590_014367 [Homalodisca vitripennis]|nr:hypothetical protein J6590_014367 [Homalodisca vitripennis]